MDAQDKKILSEYMSDIQTAEDTLYKIASSVSDSYKFSEEFEARASQFGEVANVASELFTIVDKLEKLHNRLGRVRYTD